MAINICKQKKQIYRRPDFLVFDSAELTAVGNPVSCNDGDVGKRCSDGKTGITCVAKTGVECRGNGGVGIACSGSSTSVVCIQSNHSNSCRKSTGTSDLGKEEI